MYQKDMVLTDKGSYILVGEINIKVIIMDYGKYYEENKIK